MRAMSEPAEMSGRDLLEAALRGAAPPPPYVRLLNMRFIAVSDGSATFEMPATVDLYNPNNVVHGGALTSLADSAMGFAVFSTLAAGETFTTAELHVNFLRPVTADSGMLRSIGRVVHRGQQLVVAEAEVLDQQDQLIARASSTNVILQRRLAQPPPPPSVAPAAPTGPPPMPSGVPFAPAPAPEPAPRFTPPPSPLERTPTPTVSPSLATELISAAPLARTKRKIRTFAGDVAYLRKGQGPALLLLHGIPSSSYLWRDVIDPLAATFDVLAPDLLGYGDSDKRLDADLAIAAQARYMVAFMESIGVHQAAVVGHDIGGGIAQLMAADEPQRVARLILIDSVVDNNWPVADIARLKEPAWDQIMVNIDLRKGLRKGLEAGIVTEGRVTDELVDEWTRPFQDLGGRRAYLRAARALNNRDLVSRSKHIEEIETPTLIVWGANDKFLEPQWAEALKHKLRDTAVEIIDPGGHFLPLDRPDAVTEAITRFLTTR
ncbi:MAG: alpha/beta fold hydrolase [Chloroflexi bacterium]|nr:MAG: alpha/beta fold hydrolase [Chloroflexota bacterium]